MPPTPPLPPAPAGLGLDIEDIVPGGLAVTLDVLVHAHAGTPYDAARSSLRKRMTPSRRSACSWVSLSPGLP